MKKKFDIKKNKYLMSLAGTWAGCILFIGAGYGLLHLPKKEVLAQVQRQYTESKEQLETAQMATDPAICQKSKQRCEETTQSIGRYSVPQENVMGVVFEIGKIANELALSEFSSKNQKTQGYPTVGKDAVVTEAWLEVEFKGTFQRFVQFVNRLEQGTPVVFIENVEIRRDENSQNKNDVKMQLSILTTEDKPHSVASANPR